MRRALAAVVSLAAAAFVKVGTVKERHHATLMRADALELPYRAVAHRNPRAALPNFELSLDFEFPAPLSRAQFDALLQTYGSWSKAASAVAYEPARNYTLLDFLPPALQALSTLQFAAQYHTYALPRFVTGEEARRAPQRAQITVNCWAFAYDALRAAQTGADAMTIAVASPQQLWAVVTDARYAAELQSSQRDASLVQDAERRNRALRPGDYVLIFHQNPGDALFLDHIAIFLDDDLYYEKAGSGDNTPFRIVDWDGLAADWPLAVFNVSWYRPRGDAAGGAAFPEPSAAFGLHSLSSAFPLLGELKDEVSTEFCMAADVDPKDGKTVYANTYLWMKRLPPFARDPASGRAVLDDAAFSPDGLAITVPAEIYKDEAAAVVV